MNRPIQNPFVHSLLDAFFSEVWTIDPRKRGMSAAAIVNEFGANPSQNYDVHKDTAGCWCKNRTLGYNCDMTSANQE